MKILKLLSRTPYNSSRHNESSKAPIQLEEFIKDACLSPSFTKVS